MFGRPPPGGGRFLSMGGHDQSRDNPRWHANNNVLQRFLASSARVNALDGAEQLRVRGGGAFVHAFCFHTGPRTTPFAL